MRRTLVLMLALVLLGSVVAVAGDSSSASNVPKIIRIDRDSLKVGKEVLFSGLVRQVRQASRTGNANVHWVAGTPMTGSGPEVVFLEFYNSYADVEQGDQAFHKTAESLFRNPDFNRDASDAITGSRGIIARFREDLSYRPEKLDIANATRWEIETIRLKPGTSREWSDLIKESIEFHKRSNIDEHWVVYEVQFGMPGPAVIFIHDLRSLADLDVDLSEAHKAAIPESHRRRSADFTRDAVIFVESSLISVSPELSHPSEAIVAANPSFWTVKEPEAVAKGKGKGKAPVQPAIMKEGEPKKDNK